MSKFWAGSAPIECDVCRRPILVVFIDGATKSGPWANMDPACHQRIGVGLGIGKGQRYEMQPDGRWLNTWW